MDGRQTASSHILTVDFARGIFAFGVMLYHLLAFEHLIVLERVANYAVYGFFVISGFAMYVAYRARLGSSSDITAYFVARLFRIAPLFYTALMLRLVLGRNSLPDDMPYLLFFNVFLLFGFANPGGTSLVPGGWSIGVELVYYVLFPILIATTKARLLPVATIAICFFVGQILFVNHVLDHAPNLTPVWGAYAQPMSFVGYFAAGCVVGAMYTSVVTRLKGHAAIWVIVVVAIVPFLFVDDSDTVGMLTGTVGAVLAASIVVLVAGVAFLPEPRGMLCAIAKFFGAMSYPVYLLHNLVHSVVDKLSIPTAQLRIAATVVLTVVLSVAVHRFVEVPALVLGRRISAYIRASATN